MPWPCEQRKKKKKWPEWNYPRSLCTHKVRALHQRRVNSQDAATQMSRISVIHELALCVTWGHLLSPDEWLLRTADTWGDHVKSSQNTFKWKERDVSVDIHVIYFILLKPDMVNMWNTVGRYRLQRYIRALQYTLNCEQSSSHVLQRETASIEDQQSNWLNLALPDLLFSSLLAKSVKEHFVLSVLDMWHFKTLQVCRILSVLLDLKSLRHIMIIVNAIIIVNKNYCC